MTRKEFPAWRMDTKPRAFLFIRLKGIGETVMLLPLVDLIQRVHPGSEVDLVVGSPLHELVQKDPRIRAVHVVDWAVWKKGTWTEKLLGYMRFARRLRGRLFDLVVDFHGNRDTQGLARVTRSRRRVGRASGHWTDILLDRVYPLYESEGHNTENLAAILRAEGITGPLTHAQLEIPEEACLWAENWIAAHIAPGQSLFGISPGAGIIPREWPGERFAAVGRALVNRYGAAVFVHGGPDERCLVDGLVSVIGRGAIPLFAPRLDYLAALSRSTRVFLTNDTGPAHVAAAAGARVVAIFGSTRPQHSGPFGGNWASVQVGLDCVPCGNAKFSCWHQRCMNDITPAMVLEKIEQMLKDEGSGGAA